MSGINTANLPQPKKKRCPTVFLKREYTQGTYKTNQWVDTSSCNRYGMCKLAFVSQVRKDQFVPPSIYTHLPSPHAHTLHPFHMHTSSPRACTLHPFCLQCTMHGDREDVIRKGWSVHAWRGCVYTEGMECVHGERVDVYREKGWSVRAWGEG